MDIFEIWLIGYIVCCILVVVAVMKEDEKEPLEPAKYFKMILVGFTVASPLWFIVLPASFIASQID